MPYEFSIPMPYHKEHVNIINNINKQIIKSKISSFYFSLPSNCAAFTGFEQYRNISEESSFEYWKELIKYSVDEGYELVYTFNSPNSILANSADINLKLEKLDFLLKELKKLGCYKVRVSNLELLSYLNENYPDIELYASTSLEYKTIKEYQNFKYLHPNVKQIVASHDISKNFRFLKNLKDELKDTEIELILNEGCVGGCPLRREHSCVICNKVISGDRFSGRYFISQCSKIIDKNIFLEIFKSNVIYPWDIKEYAKIGIKNFKLVGRDYHRRFDLGNVFDDYLIYLSGIDDINNIKDNAFRTLFHRYRQSEELKFYIDDIKPYLPKIEHFKKYGHLCASDCGTKCKYCFKCAEKAQKRFSINSESN